MHTNDRYCDHTCDIAPTLVAGSFRLISRHAPYAGVNEEGAALWLSYMEQALDSVLGHSHDRERLLLYFRYTAAYIVRGRCAPIHSVS